MEKEKHSTTVKIGKSGAGVTSATETQTSAVELPKVSSRRSDRKKKIILIAGIAICLLAVAQFFRAPSGGQSVDLKNITDTNHDAWLSRSKIAVGESERSILKNPKISWFQRTFCTGFEISVFCNTPALHPMVEFYEAKEQKDYKDIMKEAGRDLEDERRMPGVERKKIR